MELTHKREVVNTNLVLAKKILEITKEVPNLIFQKKDQCNQSSLTNTFGFEDNAILGIYLSLLDKVDSILTLYESHKSGGCESIARSILEAKVYLFYILKQPKHIAQKAEAYSVARKVDLFNLYRTLTSHDNVGKRLRSFLGITHDEIIKKTTEKVFLNQETECRKKFRGLIKVKESEKYPKWYDGDGQTSSFKKLCTKVDLGHEYELLYSIFSADAHANDGADMFNFQPTGVNDIYELTVKSKDSALVIIFIIDTLKVITKKVLKYYKMEKEMNTYVIKFDNTYRISRKFK